MLRRAVLALVSLLVLAAAAFAGYRYGRRNVPAAPSRAATARRTHAARPTPDAPDAASPRPRESPPAAAPPRAFRMDARHTGRSGYTLPRHPHVIARVETGARVSGQAVLAANGRVVFGSHDGVVYAADPSNGRVAWRLATGDRVYTTPLVAPDARLYLGSDADRFIAVTRTGSLDVALATDDDADTSAAAAPDGTLRFAAGRVLYSVDPDLTVRWRLAFAGKLFSSPAVLADGTAVLGCQDDSVYAVDAAGAVRWHVATQGDVDAPPCIDDAGTVYVGSDDGALYALSTTDGAVRWRRALGGYVRAGAALGLDGAVVVGTYGPHPRIVALERATGQVRWSVPVAGPPTADYGVASAALVDREGRYAVGTPDDALLVLSPGGEVEARIALPGDVDSPPVLISDGVIAVGCDDGALYLLAD